MYVVSLCASSPTEICSIGFDHKCSASIVDVGDSIRGVDRIETELAIGGVALEGTVGGITTVRASA